MNNVQQLIYLLSIFWSGEGYLRLLKHNVINEDILFIEVVGLLSLTGYHLNIQISIRHTIKEYYYEKPYENNHGCLIPDNEETRENFLEW